MCFQAIVAALVYLTVTCICLTESHVLVLGPDFQADEEVMSWIGKRRDLFYLHTHSGAIDLYDIKFKLPALIN